AKHRLLAQSADPHEQKCRIEVARLRPSCRFGPPIPCFDLLFAKKKPAAMKSKSRPQGRPDAGNIIIQSAIVK
ncbi:hypothetical protein, partial [Klebsiella aerogenes]|uniref:hypothetical protein n=1 Tax=Klebsiella aerogenes TaxID=548 RepID=UPI0019544F36